MSENKSIGSDDIEALRREYDRQSLLEDNVEQDPLKQFDSWLEKALKAEMRDANAMTLATATKSGKPSCRIVLLKGFDERGFRFFSNYESRKGVELAENPNAALCFFWPVLERQVRIEGKVIKISREESEEYFKTRPRLSKIGAWTSRQSSEIASRDELKEKFSEVKEQFGEAEIPMPEQWGGYIMEPSRMEFWQGRPGRLHDRILYTRESGGWDFVRLAP